MSTLQAVFTFSGPSAQYSNPLTLTDCASALFTASNGGPGDSIFIQASPAGDVNTAYADIDKLQGNTSIFYSPAPFTTLRVRRVQNAAGTYPQGTYGVIYSQTGQGAPGVGFLQSLTFTRQALEAAGIPPVIFTIDNAVNVQTWQINLATRLYTAGDGYAPTSLVNTAVVFATYTIGRKPAGLVKMNDVMPFLSSITPGVPDPLTLTILDTTTYQLNIDRLNLWAGYDVKVDITANLVISD